MTIESDQLTYIICPHHYSSNKVQLITDSLNLTFIRYQINTGLRMCHFLAQVLHESSAFRNTAELWGPSQEPSQERVKFATRTDSGNSPSMYGDGYKYRGRGWISLTGKADYQMASRELHQDFINNPDLLQQYPWAAMVSGWFWQRRNLNPLADKDDIISITKIVSGNMNGLNDRIMWLEKTKAAIL